MKKNVLRPAGRQSPVEARTENKHLWEKITANFLDRGFVTCTV